MSVKINRLYVKILNNILYKIVCKLNKNTQYFDFFETLLRTTKFVISLVIKK